MQATSDSLGSLCQVVDFVGSTASNPYDCCANPDNNKAQCILRQFATATGSVTTPGNPGECLSSDTLCQ